MQSPAMKKTEKHNPLQQEAKKANMVNQPIAVWAVAFASIIAFMGLGLVDPILPMMKDQCLR